MHTRSSLRANETKHRKKPRQTATPHSARDLFGQTLSCTGWLASHFDTLTRPAQFGGAMIAISFRGARAFRHKLLIHPLAQACIARPACVCPCLFFCVCESWTLLFPSHSTIGPNFEPRTVSAPAPQGARLPRNSWFVLR